MITWGKIMNFEEDEDALVVELYAQQWNWKARYGGEEFVAVIHFNLNRELLQFLKRIKSKLPKKK